MQPQCVFGYVCLSVCVFACRLIMCLDGDDVLKDAVTFPGSVLSGNKGSVLVG